MGRVWTGRQALANGLIDELGGLHEAVAAARRLADLPADAQVELWHLPAAQGLVQQILAGDRQALAAAGRWLLYRTVQQDLRTARTALTSTRWQEVDPVFTD